MIYMSGYKYQLARTHIEMTGIRPSGVVEDGFIRLSTSGRLKIRDGYAWDGPSGPTFDTNTFMTASLVHDALYQLIRKGLLPKWARVDADRILYRIARRSGMWIPRALYTYLAVRLFAGKAAEPESIHRIYTAP